MKEHILEALERLAMPDELHKKECERLGISLTEDYETVKQAIIESQESKRKVEIEEPKEDKSYLKWEILVTGRKYNCKLNGKPYVVQLFAPFSSHNNEWTARLTSDDVWFFIEEQDSQFFDDLHLEVEE